MCAKNIATSRPNESVGNRPGGTDILEEYRSQLSQQLVRIMRLSETIDNAFGGNVFVPQQPPTSPANRRRFKVYLRDHWTVLKLFSQGMDLYNRLCVEAELDRAADQRETQHAVERRAS